MAGRGQVSWLPDLSAAPSRDFCVGPSGWHAVRARDFLARSQWRDRAGFSPDFP
jgi:hypothetical protein